METDRTWKPPREELFVVMNENSDGPVDNKAHQVFEAAHLAACELNEEAVKLGPPHEPNYYVAKVELPTGGHIIKGQLLELLKQWRESWIEWKSNPQLDHVPVLATAIGEIATIVDSPRTDFAGSEKQPQPFLPEDSPQAWAIWDTIDGKWLMSKHCIARFESRLDADIATTLLPGPHDRWIVNMISTVVSPIREVMETGVSGG